MALGKVKNLAVRYFLYSVKFLETYPFKPEIFGLIETTG